MDVRSVFEFRFDVELLFQFEFSFDFGLILKLTFLIKVGFGMIFLGFLVELEFMFLFYV